MLKSSRRLFAALIPPLACTRQKPRRTHRPQPRSCAAAIENLEDRRLLSVITVTSLADTVGNDEALTLREAILIANDSTGATSFEGVSSTDVADLIVFEENTIVPGDVILLTQGQLPTVVEELTIDGTVVDFDDTGVPLTGEIVIDAQGNSRIFENASNLTLRNLVLQNGFVALNGGAILNQSGAVLSLADVEIAQSTAVCCGGGLYNLGEATITRTTFVGNTADFGGGLENDGVATISDSTFSNNVAQSSGGGLYNFGVGDSTSFVAATITITNTTISGNTAVDGGGLRNDGTATITGSTISGNAAANGGGGINNFGFSDPNAGVFIAGTLTIDNTTTSGNTALNGGGLLNFSQATITGGTFSGNTATGGDGGGIANDELGTLVLQGTQVSNNIASLEGGGLANAGTAMIAGGAFSGNLASVSGGAIANKSGATVTITGSTISGNEADADGGGLSNSGAATITNSTFSLNIADSGAGISNHDGGTATITGGTISQNTAQFFGGGIFNGVLGGPGAAVTITGVTISGNTASEGAGLHNSLTGAVATILNSIISGNTATSRGGGVSNSSGAVVTVTDSQISGNSADLGGGLQNDGTATVTRGTILGNVALTSGGGIFNTGTLDLQEAHVLGNNAQLDGGGIFNDDGTLTITGSTLEGNGTLGTNQGGGLFNSGSAALTASTVIGNQADFGGGILNTGTLVLDQASISFNFARFDGGGIDNLGNLTVTGGTFNDNEADRDGGALFNFGDATITAATIRDNQAQFDGAGIGNVANLAIVDSTISGNTAGADGGGIDNFGGEGEPGVVTIRNSTVSGNTAVNGGGIFNAGQLLVDGTDGIATINGNTSQGSGGGLFNAAGATASLAFVTVAGNSSGQGGGGIANFGDLTIAGSTISGNIAAGNGGGIVSFGSESGAATLSVENSTISGNQALDGGGISSGGGTVALRSVTVASNVASGNGGGVNIGASEVSATSTIIASNAASAGPDVRGALADLGFNLIGNTAGMAFATGQAVSTLVNVDPRLGPLEDNGGPTFTHALLPGSPAIDNGSNPTEALFDQRGPGFSRTVGDQTDIGAFEAQSPPAPGLIVVGSGLGAPPEIRIFDPETDELVGSFAPFPSFFRGGIHVATGDVNGDGVADIVASASSKGPPRLRVFDGTDLTGGTVLMDFFAYDSAFGGGVFVATGDVNNDGRADIITGAGAGGGPHVKVFSGADLSSGTLLMSFFAYNPLFSGGVQVAAGDVDGDGRDDVITGAGPGGGPHVRVFSGADPSAGTVLMNFYAYAEAFSGGVFVASGDLNDDGRDDVITGAGFGGGPHVRAFSGADLSAGTLLANFYAYGPAFSGGVRVASADVNGDGIDDIITGAGPLGGPHVRAFDGLTGAEWESFFAASPDFAGGVFVAGTSRRRSEPPPPSFSPGTITAGFSAAPFDFDDLFSARLVVEDLLLL